MYTNSRLSHVSEAMPEDLLNENQQRRVGTHLRLLGEDLVALQRMPELRRPGQPYDEIGTLVTELRLRTDAMRQEFGLPPDHGPSLKRRVAALAEVWATHLEDLRPKGLKAYGRVHHDLARHIEPHLNGIIELLYRLGDVAAELPER